MNDLDSNEYKATYLQSAALDLLPLLTASESDKLWCFLSDRSSCHSYPMKLTDLHKDFPMSITTAFQHQNYIFIIKGSLYYKIPVSKFPLKMSAVDLEAKYIFQDLLGCDEGMYTNWGFNNYEEFIDKFAKRMQNEKSFSEEVTHFNPTFLIVTFLILFTGCTLLSDKKMSESKEFFENAIESRLVDVVSVMVFLEVVFECALAVRPVVTLNALKYIESLVFLTLENVSPDIN
ncbi:unnamed protein product [Medioppia subpectinata]|uniref:Uncharacterized protein n=1 Tax=Medioppia subpectinata TaxID=1979941 RepID=A0A7R9Q0L7_9ACAR|nr:unnamed protein product [Medioppia subpectinata]CAG2107677.1 unnamed protein product [Medioppia subpectinata]